MSMILSGAIESTVQSANAIVDEEAFDIYRSLLKRVSCLLLRFCLSLRSTIEVQTPLNLPL